MKNLYLIGPRGAGKSTAGIEAARLLGVPFVDTDQEIEQKEGQSISELFARKGEPAFRMIERSVMLELFDREGLLVATGGGCVLDPTVCQRLQASKCVLWLTAPLSVLQRRISGSGRPALVGSDPGLELAEVVKRRESIYRTCATWSVDTGSRSFEEVVHVIQHFWAQPSRDNLR